MRKEAIDKTMKGFGMTSHRGGCFNNLGAKAIDSVGTA
jgi:hypothetical protein